MVDLGTFDAREIEPADFEPVPAGRYVVVMTDSAWRTASTGRGEFLECCFQIIEGPHAGRYLWARLNLRHDNTQAVAIAMRELAAICRAVNVLAPRDSSELHNLPLIAKVAVRTRQDTGEKVNVIRGYARRPAPSAQSRPESSSPPWQRAGSSDVPF